MESTVFYQAIIFGITTILVGLVLSMLFDFLKPTQTAECENFDKYYIMEVVLFFTGVILRYSLEYPMLRQYIL